METLFDFNPTEEELYLVGVNQEEEYLNGIDKKTALRDIALLFFFRNDEIKMRTYINKTRDNNMIHSFWRTIGHYKMADNNA